MNFKILYTESYNKKAASFIRRHPDLAVQYEKTLKLLEANPFHPSLRLHRLKGPLEDLHSVSINISYRITLEFLMEDKTIIPVNVGKHVFKAVLSVKCRGVPQVQRSTFNVERLSLRGVTLLT